MSDLIKRLRAYCDPLDNVDVRQQAADRIEALEAALREITQCSFLDGTAYKVKEIARAALAPEQKK